MAEALLPPAPLGLPPALRLCPKVELLDRVLVRMAAGRHRVRMLMTSFRPPGNCGWCSGGFGLPRRKAAPCADAVSRRNHRETNHTPKPQRKTLKPSSDQTKSNSNQIQTKQKVLVFSTMTRALDELEPYLAWRGWRFARLDGGRGTAAERGDLVARFNDPGERGGGGTTPCTALHTCAHCILRATD